MINNKRISLCEGDIIYFVKISDIIYAKSEASHTIFYITKNKIIVTAKALKEFEQILIKHLFVRSHHSYLINLKKVLQYNKNGNETLLLKENHSVPISSRKKEQVLSILCKQ